MAASSPWMASWIVDFSSCIDVASSVTSKRHNGLLRVRSESGAGCGEKAGSFYVTDAIWAPLRQRNRPNRCILNGRMIIAEALLYVSGAHDGVNASMNAFLMLMSL